MRTLVLSLAFLLPISATVPATAAAAERVAGVVVDQSGQLLPRAFVRVVDGSGREIASAFSDERGGFDLPAPATGCRVEGTLIGFTTASIPCDATGTLRLVLSVAPVQESVVVSATRTEALANQVGASVTTFTAEDIARRREPLLADLLRSVPGAMVIRAGAPGGVTSLFVRGGESNYNKVLLDGIPLNEPGGTFYFSNMTTENFERVEIVRGAQSALFGSDAMSSVVQMFTKRASADAPLSGTATFEGGSLDTYRVGGAASGRSGRVDYSAGVAYLSTANNVPNDDFENTTVSGNVGAALNETTSLRFIGRAELGRNGAPGQTAYGRPDLDAFGKRHDIVGGVSFDQQLTPTFHQQAVYSLAASDQQSTDLIADPDYVPSYQGHVAPFPYSDFLYDSRTNLHRHHLGYQSDIRLANDATHGSQLLTALADWDGERATLEDRLAGTSTPESRDNAGLAVQHQAMWRRVSFTVGGRFEHNASFGNAFVPRGSAAFVAHPAAEESAFGATTVHFAAGKGIKEPTLLQSFSPSPFFRGNPDLAPERARSFEIGIDQRFASDRARVTLTWFDNDYRDLIALETTNFQTFEAQYFNVGHSRARGAELSFEVVPVQALRARFGYTYLDSKVLESTSPTNSLLEAGQPLLRRPKNSGFVDLAWSRGPFTAGIMGLFVGEYLDSDFSSLEPPLVENPGYTTWDLRLSYRFLGRLTGLFSIDNLANADYMEPLGYPALGRAVRAGVRVGF
jgi:outer membrane cobalamin receptor